VGGSVIRWYKLAREQGRLLDALNVILYDRFVHTLAILGAGLVFLLADGWSHAHRSRWISAGVIGVAFALQAGLRLLLFNGSLAARVRDWMPRRLSERFRRKLEKAGTRADELARIPRALRRRVWLWSAAIALLNALWFFLLARAAGLDTGFLTLAWARTVVFALNMLPITVAGLGVREGALLFLLQPAGAAAEDVLAFSLLAFLNTLALAALGGLFEAHALLLGRSDGRRAAQPPGREVT
jgi:uncharacterized membrane protein YbhN (UPF0104 family)